MLAHRRPSTTTTTAASAWRARGARRARACGPRARAAPPTLAAAPRSCRRARQMAPCRRCAPSTRGWARRRRAARARCRGIRALRQMRTGAWAPAAGPPLPESAAGACSRRWAGPSARSQAASRRMAPLPPALQARLVAPARPRGAPRRGPALEHAAMHQRPQHSASAALAGAHSEHRRAWPRPPRAAARTQARRPRRTARPGAAAATRGRRRRGWRRGRPSRARRPPRGGRRGRGARRGPRRSPSRALASPRRRAPPPASARAPTASWAS